MTNLHFGIERSTKYSDKNFSGIKRIDIGSEMYKDWDSVTLQKGTKESSVL